MNSSLHTVGILQTRAHRILQARVSDCLAEHGLNHGQWVMLGVVAESSEGIRLNSTADILGVKAPMVTAMANEMMTQGYIERISHGSDRRAKLLMISETGQALLRNVEQDLRSTLLPLLDGLTVSELETYQKVLLTIISNSEQNLRNS